MEMLMRRSLGYSSQVTVRSSGVRRKKEADQGGEWPLHKHRDWRIQVKKQEIQCSENEKQMV